MKAALVAAIAFAFLPISELHAQTTPTVKGFWQETDDQGNVGAWFYFSQKDGVYIGRLVKSFPKPGEPHYSVCSKCQDERKNARMLGLTIVSGMKRDGLKYTDGSILDPRDGSIYHAEMELSQDGQELSVRGYIGIPLLGQTQVWKRLPDDTIAAADIPKEVLAKPKQRDGDAE
ncbi:MAG: DUF2147 domain-containing protein [Hyphomicrobiales bacterium]|nr:DUF2147 domain-containing protein [Hyphomicrobiales bacterium]MBV8663011.1 DUF2147 domain-containing protein [Hyphomicrobiales bacterium]